MWNEDSTLKKTVNEEDLLLQSSVSSNCQGNLQPFTDNWKSLLKSRHSEIKIPRSRKSSGSEKSDTDEAGCDK